MVSFFFVMTFNETKQCHNIQGQEDSSGLLVFWRLTINPQTFARSLSLWRPNLFRLLHLVMLLLRAWKTILNVASTCFTTLGIYIIGIQYLHSGSLTLESPHLEKYSPLSTKDRLALDSLLSCSASL